MDSSQTSRCQVTTRYSCTIAKSRRPVLLDMAKHAKFALALSAFKLCLIRYIEVRQAASITPGLMRPGAGAVAWLPHADRGRVGARARTNFPAV